MSDTDTSGPSDGRRFEDRDRMLNSRLDQIEHAYQALSHTVSQLENSINIVKLEQGHLKDLFSARLTVIEQSGQLQLAKMEQIALSIATMGSDVDKSPMGRMLKTDIRIVQEQVDAASTRLNAHSETHIALRQWQDRVDGVLVIVKWFGAAGLLALGLAVLRLLKVIP